MTKIIGIMGGMGPLASVDLQKKIILNTKAMSDAEHLPVLCDCNTRIPDRTRAILAGGEDPLPEMIRSARRLEAAGADVLLIACNTAHYYLEALEKQVDIPFLSMIDAALQEVQRRGAKKISILSTTGSYEIGLYQKGCRARSIAFTDPEEEDKALLMKVIYGVKGGKMHEGLEKMAAFLKKEREKGVELFILACTELPIYFSVNTFDASVLDATLALAREAICFAGGELLD